jgi:hypothetical protein
MDQHLHPGWLSQPRSGDIVKPGGVSPRFCIPQNDIQAPKGRHRAPALSSLEIAGLLADVAPPEGSGKYAVTLVPGLAPPGFMISPHFGGSEDPRFHQRKRVRALTVQDQILTAPAQTATLPWRSMSLYLDASVYAGLRQHNRATH